MKTALRHLSATTAAGLLLAVAASPAAAALIAVDDPSLGPGTIVRDTATSLDWLTLSATTGALVDDILNELLPGGRLEDFRFATNQERGRLFVDASLPPYFGASTDIAARNSFVALFTGAPRPDSTIGGFTAPLAGPGSPFPQVFGTYITQVYQLGPDMLPRFEVDTQVVNLPWFGPAFLVRRDVPEPSSLTLMAAGGAWLLLGRYRRRPR